MSTEQSLLLIFIFNLYSFGCGYNARLLLEGWYNNYPEVKRELHELNFAIYGFKYKAVFCFLCLIIVFLWPICQLAYSISKMFDSEKL